MLRQKQTTDRSLSLKPPVVVVLGHVDHGKSTLLDFIRRSNITAGEAGGITQRIGAYQVKVPGREQKLITFIDTPGHEAFAKLRARGASVADLALLVVAADDSVKPQTKESIQYIKQAKIPFIVAINKIDLPSANVKKVKKDLLKNDVVVEELGGKIACLPISAKTGEGVGDLLETILLLAQIKKISADPQGKLEGVIIESKLERRRGKVATVLVKNGTLKVGEEVTVEGEKVKVRAMFDEFGKSVREAPPGKPVEVLGFKKLPGVGTMVRGRQDRKQKTDNKKQKTKNKKQKTKNKEQRTKNRGERGRSVLKILLKADSQGSLEAVLDGLPQKVEVVSAKVGDIVQNDVSFAKTAGAVIIGFSVGVPKSILKLAEDEKVKIRTYQIIYKLFEELEEVVEILSRGPLEKILGRGRILQEFLVRKQKIAGVAVFEGRLALGDKVKIVRAGKEIAKTRIKSLKQGKEKVERVQKGEECGVRFSPEVDFKVADVIESVQNPPSI